MVFEGLVMKIKITIEKVEIHAGTEFQGTPWKHPMHVIYTNNGIFIDNSIGKCFGRSGIMWEGIDWTKHIGETVEIIPVDCVGKEIAAFTPCPSLADAARNAGGHPKGCTNHIWAYPFFVLGEPARI